MSHSKKMKEVDPNNPFTIPDFAEDPERILAKKMQDGNTLYKVKWRGVPEGKATWQAKNTLVGAEALIKRFEAGDAAPEDDQWEVESILRKRTFRGETLYLTKWRGWSDASNEWLTRECFADGFMVDAFEVREAIKAFRLGLAKSLQSQEFSSEFYDSVCDKEQDGNGHGSASSSNVRCSIKKSGKAVRRTIKEECEDEEDEEEDEEEEGGEEEVNGYENERKHKRLHGSQAEENIGKKKKGVSKHYKKSSR